MYVSTQYKFKPILINIMPFKRLLVTIRLFASREMNRFYNKV